MNETSELTFEETEAMSWLAATLGCSQCGRTFDKMACGPTHALIAADPRRHRLIAPLIEAAQGRAWDQGVRTGTSRAMRHMSDEPNLPLASDADNPYTPAPRPVAAEQTTPGTGEVDHG